MKKHSDTYYRIWDVVRKIPPGNVATYGQIAELAGFGGHARLVGYALHSLPENSDVPWYRVINARGRISLRTAEGYHNLQHALLEQEGIVFNGDRIDLERFGWNGE
jgi:methylated-DNA-protein-cysteine methyltransferase-like protein